MRIPMIASLLIAGACVSRPGPGPEETGIRVPVRIVQAGEVRTQQLATGKHVVETVCFACHTEQPPHKTAPPLAMVANHYRQATPSLEAATKRIVEWVPAPSREKSLLPPMAIERFGLMPAQQLPDSQIRAAAAYILTLQHRGMGNGMGAMGGSGHQHRGRP